MTVLISSARLISLQNVTWVKKSVEEQSSEAFKNNFVEIFRKYF